MAKSSNLTYIDPRKLGNALGIHESHITVISYGRNMTAHIQHMYITNIGDSTCVANNTMSDDIAPNQILHAPS